MHSLPCDFHIINQLVSVTMLNTLTLRTNQYQLPIMYNLTIKDKMPAPKLSIISSIVLWNILSTIISKSDTNRLF